MTHLNLMVEWQDGSRLSLRNPQKNLREYGGRGLQTSFV